jgi:hypothetical protein
MAAVVAASQAVVVGWTRAAVTAVLVAARHGVQALAPLLPAQARSQPSTEMPVVDLLLVRHEAAVAVALAQQGRMLVQGVVVALGRLTVSPMLVAAVAAHQVAAVVLRVDLVVAVPVQMVAVTQVAMLHSTVAAVAVLEQPVATAQLLLRMAVTAIRVL